MLHCKGKFKNGAHKQWRNVNNVLTANAETNATLFVKPQYTYH